MPLWLVRAGRDGERENFAIDQNVVVLGWDELPDLSGIRSRDEIVSLLSAAQPDAKPQGIANWSAQIWVFRDRIAKGDHVIVPLKSRAVIAVGKVVGDYEYHPQNPSGAKHLRQVAWINKEIPRQAFDQDLLYSLGAFLTVCQIRRHDAEKRIIAIAEGKVAPAPLASLIQCFKHALSVRFRLALLDITRSYVRLHDSDRAFRPANSLQRRSSTL